ncbi:hypothetical protein HYG77_04655 [Rhodococcus sp. ZPP]|uniref:hypothetical protein n=1 Tax=Rhodococcus sp. ZPP TaxID=2749906 RepID=UPI001AD882D7|nr:hypothetical protein [Rhodococcus sp. ZPP]QTJ64956.1 hypothetical protein HYG77_04655 [Rhodococcus sp. ZPP]
MGILTKGQLNIRIYKLRTSMSLDKIYDAAVGLRYPIDPEHQTTGWGSSWDSNVHIGQVVTVAFSGGMPQRVLRENGTAERIRLRFYWDRVSSTLKRSYGESSGWRHYHERDAFDVVIFDGGQESDHSVLVSTRETKHTRADVIPALENLMNAADPGATVSSDNLPEELDPDLFLWLLYRHKSTSKEVGRGLTITDVDEIDSLDLQSRRGRYGSGAGVDRVDLLAMIAKGQARLGPAKISVHDDLDPEADYDLHLWHDGGYSVFRSSRYKDRNVADHTSNTFGHKLVEDVFLSVLPRIRSAYSHDEAWRSTLRKEFIAASKVELDNLTKD